MQQHSLQRISFIDVAKATCIILMVIGHWAENEMLITYIYSFHMPALLIISGYLYRSHSLTKTVLGFLIPIIIFSLFNLMVKILIGELKMTEISFHYAFFGIFHYRYGLGDGLFMGDWFIWALIGLRMLFGDIKELGFIRHYYLQIAFACVIYMTLESYLIEINSLFRGYYIGLMIPSLPFFCTGLFLKNKGWRSHHVSYKFIIPLLLCSVFIPLLNGHCSINSHLYGQSYLIFFMNAIISTMTLFILSAKIPNSKYIVTISKGTFVILGTHMPILQTLEYLFPRKIYFLFPIITVTICYYLIIICEKYYPILLGKWR